MSQCHRTVTHKRVKIKKNVTKEEGTNKFTFRDAEEADDAQLGGTG